MPYFPIEVARRVAYYTATTCLADPQTVGDPFGHINTLIDIEEFRKERDACRRGILSLSVTDRTWQHAAQPYLPVFLSLVGQDWRSWRHTLNILDNRHPLFLKCATFPHRFFNVRFAEPRADLVTNVNHIRNLTYVNIFITHPLPSNTLQEVRDRFIGQATGLRTLTISVMNVHEYDDYKRILMAFLSRIDLLETLDWSTSFEDESILFFRYLSRAVHLNRLNLRLPKVFIPMSVHFGASLPCLRCLQIEAFDGKLGNQIDILSGWTFPRFDTLFMKANYGSKEMAMFIHNHALQIKNLYLDELRGNESIMEKCTALDKMYMDIYYSPYVSYPVGGPQVSFAHKSVKKVVLGHFDAAFNHFVLYRLFNKHFFPLVAEVQIADSTRIFRKRKDNIAWRYEVAQWMALSGFYSVRVTDKNGDSIQVV